MIREEQMTEKQPSVIGAEVRALRFVLIILLAVYGTLSVGSIIFAARVFPSFIRMSGTSFSNVTEMIRVLLEKVVPGLIYFFIGWAIFKLIGLCSRREPFSPASPRHARRIGYAVLIQAAVSVVVDVIKAFRWPVDLLSSTFIGTVCNVLTTSLIGFGFLVMAKVLELGVRLQQDQNLTV